ncbi:hypothetical protein VCHENC02_2883 [Vibrio harveyi]|uniref:Uncharacterized protein n=1 Tax=Vibrio harveyi TaxID=669 RepID=A0A454CYI5_VIBHA|nr:hypothetical protein VCHENC02_2883 [Vibrio harveyi]
MNVRPDFIGVIQLAAVFFIQVFNRFLGKLENSMPLQFFIF